jgi:hypothetical protein
MSRAYTEKEVKKMLFDTLWSYIDYWAETGKQQKNKPLREVLSGVVFSTLVILDGGADGMPGFLLAPCPHEDDKDYHKENDKNWFPENNNHNLKCELGGGLHDEFYKHDPQRKEA